MYVYIAAFGLSILIAGQIKKIRNLGSVFKAIISSLPVLFITGLRYDVGTDFFSYESYYKGIRNNLQIEMLFEYLTDAIHEINSDYQFFIFATGSIFVLIMYVAMWEQTKEVEFSISLFMLTTLYFCGINGIRQGIAIVITLYALKFLDDNTKTGTIKFTIAVIMAMLIHDTVIICLAYPLLKKININFGKSVIGIGLIFLFNNKIYQLTGELLKRFSPKHYGSFINAGAVDVGESYIIVVVGVFLVASYIKAIYEVDERFNMLYNIIFFSIILGIFTVWLAWGKRLMWNYMFVSIFLIPESVNYLRMQRNRIIVGSGFAVALFILMYFSIAILGTHRCIPYHWIL